MVELTEYNQAFQAEMRALQKRAGIPKQHKAISLSPRFRLYRAPNEFDIVPASPGPANRPRLDPVFRPDIDPPFRLPA
jgi:hypothetical protein